MQQGPLRHRLSFSVLTESVDSNGYNEQDWLPYLDGKRFWCSVKYPKAKESEESESIRNRKNAIFTMRFNPNIVETMRVEFKNKSYNIESIQPDNESGREFMIITAYTGLNQG